MHELVHNPASLQAKSHKSAEEQKLVIIYENAEAYKKNEEICKEKKRVDSKMVLIGKSRKSAENAYEEIIRKNQGIKTGEKIGILRSNKLAKEFSKELRREPEKKIEIEFENSKNIFEKKKEIKDPKKASYDQNVRKYEEYFKRIWEEISPGMKENDVEGEYEEFVNVVYKKLSERIYKKHLIKKEYIKQMCGKFIKAICESGTFKKQDRTYKESQKTTEKIGKDMCEKAPKQFDQEDCEQICEKCFQHLYDGCSKKKYNKITETRKRIYDKCSIEERNEPLFEKIMETFLECNEKGPELNKKRAKEFKQNNLLKVVVEKEHWNYIIIYLLDKDHGMHLYVKYQENKHFIGTVSYENIRFMTDILNNKIPFELKKAFDLHTYCLYYHHHLIAEIIDFRGSLKEIIPLESYFLLLEPDSTYLDMEFPSCEHLEKRAKHLFAKSQYLWEISEPLCLDPNPAVGIFLNRHGNFRCDHLGFMMMDEYDKSLLSVSSKEKITTLFQSFVSNTSSMLESLPAGVLSYSRNWYWSVPEISESSLPPVRLDVSGEVSASSASFVEIEKYIFAYEVFADNKKEVKYDTVYIFLVPSEQLYYGSLRMGFKDFHETVLKPKMNYFQIGFKDSLIEYICQMFLYLSDGYSRNMRVFIKKPGSIADLFFMCIYGVIAANEDFGEIGTIHNLLKYSPESSSEEDKDTEEEDIASSSSSLED